MFQRGTRGGGGCGGGDGAGAGGGFLVEVDGGGKAFPEGGVADDGHCWGGWEFEGVGIGTSVVGGLFEVADGGCYRWREVWVEGI